MRIVEPVFGPFAGYLLSLPDAEADKAIADKWARERYDPAYPQAWEGTAEDIASATAAANESADVWGGNPPQPVLTSINPNTAVVGSINRNLHAIGSSFVASSVIVFNGGEEQTDFVSETELTTTVKPSTASGPITVPVLVRSGNKDSAPQDFTFTASEG